MPAELNEVHRFQHWVLDDDGLRISRGRACASHAVAMPAGYLLVSAFHKQAFASATQHQLLAFLQVAAFTNRTAVLPFARFGEPAFVGLPEAGFHDLERYFDVADLAKRWPCPPTGCARRPSVNSSCMARPPPGRALRCAAGRAKSPGRISAAPTAM